MMTTREVVVDADADQIPVGVDGEALLLDTPVHCTVQPGALRVRVPRNRPGVPEPKPVINWHRLWQMALAGPGTGRSQMPSVVTHDPEPDTNPGVHD